MMPDNGDVSKTGKPGQPGEGLFFYPLAVIFALVALFVNGAGRELCVKAARLRAQEVSAMQEQRLKSETNHEPFVTPRRDPEISRLVQTGHTVQCVGLGLTLASIGCIGKALSRRERGWYIILIFLIFCDFVMLVLL